MMTFLVFKERLRQFYGKYELYITPVGKFLSAWVILMILNQQVGFMTQLTNPMVTMVVSLVSAVVPGSLTVLMLCGITMMHVFTLSMELAAVVGVLLVVMYILYFRFVPKEAMVILWIPVLFHLRIPVLVPIIIGLIGTPLSVISVAFGTIFHFVLDFMANSTSLINNVASGDAVQKINVLVNGLLKNQMLLLSLLAFVLVVIIVYIIRRMSVNYAWQIAIICGAMTNLVIMLVGNLKLDLTKENPVVWIVAGNLIAMIIALLLQFFILSLDYSCTEYVQFEDDEYYYYVKAVPKITVTAPQVNVKKINAKKSKTEMFAEDEDETERTSAFGGASQSDDDVPPLDIDLKMISEMADMEERLRQERARRRQMAAAREEQMLSESTRRPDMNRQSVQEQGRQTQPGMNRRPVQEQGRPMQPGMNRRPMQEQRRPMQTDMNGRPIREQGRQMQQDMNRPQRKETQ